MERLDLKLQAIAKILVFREFGCLNQLEELSGEEVAFLYSKFNIRFSDSPSGQKCFLSSKIGKAGIANNKVQALTFMLDIYHFRPSLEKNILEQLEAVFCEEVI